MTGLVLAGGQSQRMGVPKAFLRLDGETFLERAASLLRDVCGEVIIAAAPGQPVPGLHGCKLVRDEQPGLGPLGGLAAGLASSGDQWHLALACDLPLARPGLLRLVAGSAAGDPPVDAFVPRAGGRLQPLLAAYSSRCLDPAREALAAGQRAVAAMLDRVEVRVLEEEALRAADPDLVSFVNVNTWEEYQAVKQCFAERNACR